jgi:hypothetical protein
MNPEHQRPNPQRAVEEYKKNTPPLVKLGQGREEAPELDHYIEMVFVLVCTSAAIGTLMFICYLAGGWQ